MIKSADRGDREMDPGCPTWKQRLHIKFLAIVSLTFLAIIIPGAWMLFAFMNLTDEETLTSRIGNLAARSAGAIERHGAFDDLSLARDLMAPLAADRAFLCAELRLGESIAASLPAGQGCVTGQAGHQLFLPIDDMEIWNLRIEFTDAEIREARQLEILIGVGVISITFLAVLIAGGLAYRFLISRPLNRLTGAIRQAARTGQRDAVMWQSRDEMGMVIDAYDSLVRRECKRERQLNATYDKIRKSEAALNSLNHDLEARVRDRTEELETAKREADRANESKTQFLWSMSHELRTPLNAIIGFSEIMSQQVYGPVQPPRYKEFADDILFSGRLLLKVINDLLDIARIEVGKETLHEEPVCMANLLSECKRVVQPLAEEKQLTLRGIVIDAGLTLSVDATKTKQILLNIASNAIKNTPVGGSVSITIGVESDGRAAMRVSDTGCGIALEDIPLVLEPFGRVQNDPLQTPKGTGLGLPLARKMIEMHGGEMVLESEVGIGTTVTISYPSNRVLERSPTPARMAYGASY